MKDKFVSVCVCVCVCVSESNVHQRLVPRSKNEDFKKERALKYLSAPTMMNTRGWWCGWTTHNVGGCVGGYHIFI